MITPDEVKQVGDAAGVVTTAATLIEILPAISAALTSLWFLIRIYQELKSLRSNK